MTVAEENRIHRQSGNYRLGLHSSLVFRRVAIYAVCGRLILLVVVSQFFSFSDLAAQVFKTLSVEFEHSEGHGLINDSTIGVIYYQRPDYTFVKVVEPITQSIIFRDSTMVIYYPNEGRAFQFSSSNPYGLPFFYAFIAVAFDDLGLSKSGLSITNSEMLGDTLLVTWGPPGFTVALSGNITAKYVDNGLTALEFREKDGQLISITRYAHHFEYRGVKFPLEVLAEHFPDNYRERVVYSNPQFDVELPAEILDFQLPADVDLKVVKW